MAAPDEGGSSGAGATRSSVSPLRAILSQNPQHASKPVSEEDRHKVEQARPHESREGSGADDTIEHALSGPATHLREAGVTAIILAIVFSGLAAIAAPALGLAITPAEGALVGLAASLSSPGVTIANLLQEKCSHTPAGRLGAGTLAIQDLLMGLLLSVPHVAAAR